MMMIVQGSEYSARLMFGACEHGVNPWRRG